MKDQIKTTFGFVNAEWKIHPFKDFVFFQEGPGLRKWQWTDEGMKVINVKNILHNGSIDISNTSRYISLEEFETRYSHFAVEEGDVVVASSGNTYGKVGRIQRKDLPIMMNTSVIRFHSLEVNDLDDDYLYYFLCSHLFQNQIESFVIGSAQPNFGPVHIKQMQIVLPPIHSQQKFAAILSNYDKLIENNNHRIKILEEMSRAIYREWFVNFRFPGYETIGRVDSGTELGEIPVGWEVRKLGELIKIQKGKKATEIIETEDGVSVPYLLIRGLRDGIYSYTRRDKMKIAEKDDVIMVMDGASSGEVHIGHFGAVGSTLAFFRPIDKDILSPYHLYHFLRENYKWISDNNTGSAIPHANKDFIKRMEIVLPQRQLTHRFYKINDLYFGAIENLKKTNSNLRTTRDILLPKLVSGSLDISKTTAIV
jgi:type I restriction enzyme S subunit